MVVEFLQVFARIKFFCGSAVFEVHASVAHGTVQVVFFINFFLKISIEGLDTESISLRLREGREACSPRWDLPAPFPSYVQGSDHSATSLWRTSVQTSSVDLFLCYSSVTVGCSLLRRRQVWSGATNAVGHFHCPHLLTGCELMVLYQMMLPVCFDFASFHPTAPWCCGYTCQLPCAVMISL